MPRVGPQKNYNFSQTTLRALQDFVTQAKKKGMRLKETQVVEGAILGFLQQPSHIKAQCMMLEAMLSLGESLAMEETDGVDVWTVQNFRDVLCAMLPGERRPSPSRADRSDPEGERRESA